MHDCFHSYRRKKRLRTTGLGELCQKAVYHFYGRSKLRDYDSIVTVKQNIMMLLIVSVLARAETSRYLRMIILYL